MTVQQQVLDKYPLAYAIRIPELQLSGRSTNYWETSTGGDDRIRAKEKTESKAWKALLEKINEQDNEQ